MARRVCLLVLALVGGVVSTASAQRGPDVAMRFFVAGGAYCFRLAPEGVAMAEETEWTVMVLAGAINREHTFRIRTVDPGPSGARGRDLTNIGLSVTSVWRMDSTRNEFFERYAEGIRGKTVRARVVTLTPPGLAAMTARQRGEAYLKFSDKGEKVDFGKTTDLTADAFMAYQNHVPD